MPFTSEHEDRAALALLFDPRVSYAQRADVSSGFTAAHRLSYRLPTPQSIPYVFDDGTLGPAEHHYYPDFSGFLVDGSPFLAEAGPARSKGSPVERTKAAAARDEMARRGGKFYLVTGDTLSQARWDNYALLRAHHQPPVGCGDVMAAIEAIWSSSEPSAIREITERLSEAWPRHMVEAAAWHRLCVAASSGHLVVDLDRDFLDLDVPISLLPPDAAPILPPELPSELPTGAHEPPRDAPRAIFEGPTVDSSQLSPRRKAAFLRNRRLIEMVDAGTTITAAALEVGLSKRQALRVMAGSRDEPGLVPYPHSRRATSAHPIYVDAIEKLFRSRRRLKIRAIQESPELRTAWRRIREAEGQAEPIPSRWVITRLRDALERGDKVVRERLAGSRHPERSASAVRGYVRSIPAPGLVCQVDEHVFDILLTLDGYEVASRVWGAVLIDVKTGGLLGAILSPAELVEEDYMRLLKQAIESKTPIVERFGCENDWPCSARPAQILSDRGLIFRSERATSVVVDRLGITQKIAPPWAPSAKGSAEACFRFMTERFAHRFPATTKGSPAQRGQHDSVAAAERSGMTYAEFEGYFYRAVVDGYMQAWDGLRGGPRSALWTDAVEKHGVARWIGSADELKLLLMRAANLKHPLGRYPVHKGGVSFLGHWYVGHDGLTQRLRAARDEVTILYDRRDITTIYLVDKDGVLLGPASTSALGPGPVSIWERDARRRGEAIPRAEAEAKSSNSLTDIQVDAARPRGPGLRSAKAARRRAFRESRLPDQLDDIHLTGVVDERVEMDRRRAEEEAGIIHLAAELPGPSDGKVKRRRPRIEYLGSDPHRGA